MSETVVMEEGMSRYGLHSIHMMRMGEQVDLERLIEERVLQVGGEVVAWFVYEEEALGVWHARMWWRVAGEALPSVTVTPQPVQISEEARRAGRMEA